MCTTDRVALWCDEVENQHGQGVVEYALLLTLLVLAAVSGLVVFGTSAGGLWARIVTNVGSAL